MLISTAGSTSAASTGSRRDLAAKYPIKIVRKKKIKPLICSIHNLSAYRRPNCQNATALAAATFRESTPCDMGMRTV